MKDLFDKGDKLDSILLRLNHPLAYGIWITGCG